jgi:hypothetical protein
LSELGEAALFGIQLAGETGIVAGTAKVMTTVAREMKLAAMFRNARLAGEVRITIGKPMHDKPLKFGIDRKQHIADEHALFDFSKVEQGIFRDDPIKATIAAWEKAAQVKIKPISTSRADYYIVPMEKSGFTGGAVGETGIQLDFVTIVTKPGSTDVITSFPTMQSGPTKLRDFINSQLYGGRKK